MALNCEAALLKEADCLLITVGAGMSVDSGLPAYRTPEGFWKDFPAYSCIRADYTKMTRPRGFEVVIPLPGAFTPIGFCYIEAPSSITATRSCERLPPA